MAAKLSECNITRIHAYCRREKNRQVASSVKTAKSCTNERSIHQQREMMTLRAGGWPLVGSNHWCSNIFQVCGTTITPTLATSKNRGFALKSPDSDRPVPYIPCSSGSKGPYWLMSSCTAHGGAKRGKCHRLLSHWSFSFHSGVDLEWGSWARRVACEVRR